MITICLLHNTTSFFSKIISWFEGSPISHSAIGLQINGEQCFFHAAWGGVQITPRGTVLTTHTVVAEFEVLPNITGEVQAAQSRIGQGYDVLTLFGYLPVLLGRYLHIGINNPLYSKSAEVCSELIVEIDVNHLIPEFNGLDPANVMPVDLYNICKDGQSFKLIAGS